MVHPKNISNQKFMKSYTYDDKNIITLTLNDLAIAFKNKTIYLILFIPFLFFSL